MSERNQQTLYIHDGQRGESVFTKPFLSYRRLHEHNLALAERARQSATGDDRSYVLVRALLVEYQVDRFLQIWLPDYKVLSDNQDFSFSLKISLVRASRLIPPHILRCCDEVRQIRNLFAHNLELDALDKLQQKDKDRLRTVYQETYNRPGRVQEPIKDKTIKELFNGVHFLALGIEFYEENIDILRKTMESEDFIQALSDNVQEQSKQYEAEMMSHDPERIEVRGDTKIERFPGGVARISSVKKPQQTRPEDATST